MRSMDSAESVPTERRFRDQLQVMCAGSKKSVLLQKEDYFNLIEELKEVEKTKTIEKLIRRRTDASQDPVYFADLDQVVLCQMRKETQTSCGQGCCCAASTDYQLRITRTG